LEFFGITNTGLNFSILCVYIGIKLILNCRHSLI